MDIMVDVECLGITPSALILTVAAVGFDPFGQGIYEQHLFYQRVDPEGQTSRTVDQSTVDWWAMQTQDAIDEAFGTENRISLEQTLTKLTPILSRATRIWANGVSYDIPILEHAYRELNTCIPWKFWQIMDCRTIFRLCPDVPKVKNNHHALMDCVNQVERLQQSLKQIGIRSMVS